MKSSYEVEFIAEEVAAGFRFNVEEKKVEVNSKIRNLREDLRSIIIDEAVRAGEKYEELSQSETKDSQQLIQKAREEARQTSQERYGELREEAFSSLNQE
jgi:F0F1-type ATP synthase membrane subunit b/b'